MKTISYLFFFFLVTISCCNAQERSTKDSASSAEGGSFYLSMDTKGEKLIVPAGRDSMKVFGIKIFTSEGKELLGRQINDPMKETEIDISKIPDGDYIVHIVTTEQVLYKTKFVISR